MTIRAPFEAHRGTNQVLSPAAASAKTSIDKLDKSIRLVNSGANICHVRWGTSVSGTPATTADLPVRANSEIVVQKADGEDTLSFISAAGTTLHVQTGEGGQ